MFTTAFKPSLMAGHKQDELNTPTASTMTFQAQGCGDHLCQKTECGACVDDRFKPLLEFEFLDMLDGPMLAKLRGVGWEVEKGNPIDYFDEFGDSVLHSAARKGDIQVMKVLLEMGAQPDACCKGECCCSPLMVAARWCHAGCVSLLLDHDVNTMHVNSRGETALDQVVNSTIGSVYDRTLIRGLLQDRMPTKRKPGVLASLSSTVASICASDKGRGR